MFITKMNRLFHKHGRVAFALLTLIIIVPFVLYFSAAPQELLTIFFMREDKSGITMYGKDLSQKQLDKEIMNAMITSTLQGWPINMDSSDTKKQFLNLTIDRMLILNEAKKIGLKTDDKTVANYIAMMPVFQTDGLFDIKKYTMYVYLMGRYKLTEKDMETAISENILLDLMKQQITDSVIATEAEARNFYSIENLTYYIKVLAFSDKDYNKKVETSDVNILKYYENNMHKYKTPVKSKAVIVRFNFINYEDMSKKLVTDDVVKGYYDLNKKNYEKMKQDEALKNIRNLLTEAETKKLAKADAQKFAVGVYKQIEAAGKSAGASVIFNNFAAKNNYKTIQLDKWITDKTTLIENVGNEPSLVTALGVLYPDQPVSNAVEGKKAYFVVCLTDRENPGQAKLAEVRADVINDYTSEQSKNLAKNSAETASRGINKSVAEGKKTADIIASYKFEKEIKFSKNDYKDLMTRPYAGAAAELTLKTKEGRFSPVGDSEGCHVIIYVSRIEQPSPDDFNKNKATAIADCKMFKQQAAWVNYVSDLKKNANIVISKQPNL